MEEKKFSNKSTGNAYLLLSGGQDSFVCLLWATKKFSKIIAVSIDYGQRHHLELKKAIAITKKFALPHYIYSLKDFFSKISISSLTNEIKPIKAQHVVDERLPASFVPNRNGLFLTLIATHAYNQHEKKIHLIIGACQTDYSGYPDCRDDYIKAKANELSLGLDREVCIHTPLMWKNKSEIFKMAKIYGELNTCLFMTLSCYEGSENKNKWGYGCGDCPACLLRKKGYDEFINKEGKIIS